jgi:hypothetical protein
MPAACSMKKPSVPTNSGSERARKEIAQIETATIDYMPAYLPRKEAAVAHDYEAFLHDVEDDATIARLLAQSRSSCRTGSSVGALHTR